MGGILPVPGSANTARVVIDRLDGGWSTRTFPHLLGDSELFVADNVIFPRDGIVSKRPGNVNYGGGSGATGSGSAILAMTRFYYGTPPTGKLIVHSGSKLYQGTDSSGAFASIMTGLSTSNPAHFVQVYDPDADAGAGAVVLIVCDGARVPQLWDGTTASAVSTAAGFLPKNPAGNPITPQFVCNWKYNLVYAGEPTDPTALYISDALRPERFSGYALTDSGGTNYQAYYPAGRNTNLGVITGVAQLGQALLVFYTTGIILGVNTGTYGAFEFEWYVLSATIGSPSPQSIVSFDSHIAFFGGDRFYATDSNTVVPLPDRIPSVYSSTVTSTFPPEMKTKNTVVGARRGQQYFASYDPIGLGVQSRVAVFDFQANGGWQYGALTGGAWSRFPTGMPLSCAIECRGPGDKQQFFWGSSSTDLVAQYDTGLFSDFGNPIACEIRAKSFFLDRPIYPKTIQGMYLLSVFQATTAFTSTVIPYVVLDQAQDPGPPVQIEVPASGTQYGAAEYGTFQYMATNTIAQVNSKGYPAQPSQCSSFAPGCTESSTNPFNLIGFVVEVTTDEPAA